MSILSQLNPEELAKQKKYRDARFSDTYDDIWRSVGKCVFCDLREKYILFEEHGVVLTISLYAYIDGHMMIVPRRHVKSAKDLNQKEWEAVRKFTYIAKKLIKDVHGIKGMQIVQKDGVLAQSTVDHLHFHCIPFDGPDLAKWNYRKLKYTPLENIELYKKARKKIVELDTKFSSKYTTASSLEICTGLLLINDKNELLFQERKPQYKLIPDCWTIPGGIVDDYEQSIEQELIRETFEETGVKLKQTQLKLVASKIESLTRIKHEVHIKVKYPYQTKFVWNVYLAKLPHNSKLKPGSDCQKLHWISIDDISLHPKITSGVKMLVEKLNEQL